MIVISQVASAVELSSEERLSVAETVFAMNVDGKLTSADTEHLLLTSGKHGRNLTDCDLGCHCYVILEFWKIGSAAVPIGIFGRCRNSPRPLDSKGTSRINEEPTTRSKRTNLRVQFV